MMKALMKKTRGPDGVALENIPEPSPKPGEIKVKVHATGICGTDLHIIHDEYHNELPVVMGHEYSGIVVDVGENVAGFQVGDRVVSLTSVVTCGNCIYCRQGLLALCGQRKSLGVRVNGAFAEYTVVPAKIAYRVPENVSLDEATMLEPLACVVRCVMERGKVGAGDYVLVSGPGTIGMLAMQVARACGGIVVMTGTSRDADRLKLAKELGALDAVNVEDSDAKKRLLELTKNRGFDVAIECAGAAASFNFCVQTLRKQGLLIQVGLFGKPVEADLDSLLIKEINYTNGFGAEPTSMEIALHLLEHGMVDVKPLISNKIPIDHWREAIRLAEQKVGYKTLIVPNV